MNYDRLNVVVECCHAHPLPSLVLPVVAGVAKSGAVKTPPRENTHECEGSVKFLSDEGTSCTRDKSSLSLSNQIFLYEYEIEY